MGIDLHDPKVVAMFREAGICSHLIGTGLNNIRKADFVKDWKFASSFFELTIGLERVCKLILIRQFQRENSGEYPPNNHIRKFSHSISDLVAAATRDYSTFHIGHNEIVDEMIKFFSEFAANTRYHNLDSMTKNPPEDRNPLRIWKGIQDKIIAKHYVHQPFTLEENFMINKIDSVSSFLHRDLLGNQITSAGEFYSLGRTVEIIQSYSVYYIYCILEDLTMIIINEERRYYTMPVLSEFFTYFYRGALTKKQIISKKNWIRY